MYFGSSFIFIFSGIFFNPMRPNSFAIFSARNTGSRYSRSMTVPRIGVIPITVEILRDPNDWQLLKLENGFLAAIGEDLLSEEKKKRLQGAIEDSRIVFFIAKRGYRSVGMCSVSRYFSTYACTDTGVLEDFYIEPIFRKLGIAHQLIQAAQSWCKEHHIARQLRTPIMRSRKRWSKQWAGSSFVPGGF